MFHEIIYHKFPEFFRRIFPEKNRYFPGNFRKIPEEISGKFRRKFSEISQITSLDRIVENFNNIIYVQ